MRNDRILSAIAGSEWAILPDYLETIIAIANREGDPEAVAAKVGRPIREGSDVTIRDGVAVLPIVGPIFRYANLFTEISGATSIQKLAVDFRTLVDDDTVDAVVLEIDSPGGQIAGVSEFAAQIREASNIMPVVAYVSDLGASAAYWIASAADRVIARDTARLGSVGVVLTVKRAGDRGTIEIVSTQSPYKRPNVESEDGRAKLRAMADSLADVFIESVAAYRGIEKTDVLSDFGQGGVLVGREAVAAGMADGLGSLESVIAGLSGPNESGDFIMSKDDAKPEITRDFIAAEYPAIADAFRDEGRASVNPEDIAAKARAEGAAAERARISAVREQSIPGHEKLIESLMFDGETTGEQAAVKVLAAEKQARVDVLTTMREDAPPVVETQDPVDAPKVDRMDPAARAAYEWEHNPRVRDEFLSVEGYEAFLRHEFKKSA